MMSAVPSSGIVNSMIRITGIGDRDRPECLIRISGIRSNAVRSHASYVGADQSGGIAKVIYQSQSRDIRMLLAGEVMPSRRLTPFTEPDYLAAIELIRSADVGFTNLETVVRTRDVPRANC